LPRRLSLTPTATTAPYSLSLHDALPISGTGARRSAAQAALAGADGGASTTALAPHDTTRPDPRLVPTGATCRPMARYPSRVPARDRKSTRLNSSHVKISYAVFCLKKKKK